MVATKDDQDSALNPGELHAAERFSGYTSAGADQAESFANNPINTTRESEENPDTINYTGSGQSNSSPRSFTFKGLMQKKGPIGFIIGILLGGVGGLGMFFTPGLAVVQIKEMLTEDLNDQLAAMDIRTSHVFKAKLDGMKGGVLCSGVTPAKCKFKGMSERQIKKFRAAGIDVEPVGEKTIFGKQKIESLSVTDSNGNKITIKNPSDINKVLGDRVVRSAFRKAFNPKFAGMYDKVSAGVLNKFRTNKTNKLTGLNTDEMAKNIDDSVAGRTATIEAGRLPINEDSSQSDIDRDTNGNNSLEQQKKRIGSSGFSNGFSNGLTGAVKGVGALGVVDSACTVYNTSRAVSAGAKVIRAAQLAGYAMIFLNFADQVKAGTATPEQAEFIGNKLTAIDSEQEVFDETSDIDTNYNVTSKVKNPYYGKNAFDSEGYRAAAYNDASTLTARAAQFSIGGGLIGRLSSINSSIDSALGGNTDKCGIVQNPFVRGGSLVIGVVAGVLTGGTSLAVSIGGSVAVSMALPILESYLADMISGKTVGSTTKGVDSGNAIFAGTAAMLGSTAMARGMKPLSKSEIKEYIAMSQGIKDEYIAAEVEDAKKEPFNIYNQYSFLGSLSRKVLPVTSKISTNPSTTLANLPTLLNIASLSLLSKANAVGEYNDERFSKCEDEGYKELGIDADIFCNVRYGLSEKELSYDTDSVIDYMLNKKHIDENGNPDSDSYNQWIEECVNRTTGWGDSPDGVENGGEGKICIDGDGKVDQETLSHFRVYTIDNSINEAMEYEGPSSNGPGVTVMSFNVLNESSGKAGAAGKKTINERRQATVDTILEKNPDIVGFQELDTAMNKQLETNLQDYDKYPSKYDNYTHSGRSIYWNSSKFSLSDSGSFSYPYNTATGTPDRISKWIKLRSIHTGSEVFVVNIHPRSNSPADCGGSRRCAENRKIAAQNTVRVIQENNKENLPVVIIGDLNSKPYMRSYDFGGIDTLPLTIFSKAGYTDSKKLAKAKINENYKTSHGKAGTNPDLDKTSGYEDKIDYVLVSSDISVNSWENIISEPTRSASDHSPVMASLSIPGFGNTTSNSSIPSGTAQELAQQILDNKNIIINSGGSSTNIGYLRQIQNTANGKPAENGINIDQRILQVILIAARDSKVNISSLVRVKNFPNGNTKSRHNSGGAVDFGSIGNCGTGRGGECDTVIQRIIDSGVIKGAGFGQSTCAGANKMNRVIQSSGYSTFKDGCNHLHIQIP